MKYREFFSIFCLLFVCDRSGLKLRQSTNAELRTTSLVLTYCVPAIRAHGVTLRANGGRERKVQECSARGALGALFPCEVV